MKYLRRYYSFLLKESNLSGKRLILLFTQRTFIVEAFETFNRCDPGNASGTDDLERVEVDTPDDDTFSIWPNIS